MDLTLYVVLLVVALLFIAIGLFRPEHTELALAGFLFLFLLGMIMNVGDIQYKIGTSTEYNYSCLDPCGNGTDATFLTSAHEYDEYATFTAGGNLSHLVGYWTAVVSIVGFIGVLISLKGNRWFK